MGEHVVCSEQVLLPVFLALARDFSTDARQIAQACCTCKAFRDVGSADVVWKELFEQKLWVVPKEDVWDLPLISSHGYKWLYGAYWETLSR
jgi:hypothetical protein